MGTIKQWKQLFLTCAVLLATQVHSAVHELSQVDERPTLYRQARDDRYYQQRYGAATGGADRDRDRDRDRGRRTSLKPGDPQHPEARGGERDPQDQQQGAGVEKRCIRCTTSNLDPYEYRDYYDRDRYYDRYDDRRYDDRYNNYDRYDRYDSRTSYYDRDRWYDRRPTPSYYDNDRWYYDYRGSYDRYDRSYDRYDRGFGYDNRGYDNRGYDSRRTYDYRGYRPWDETARGTSGWDQYGRGGGGSGGGGGGYYSNRPDYWGYDRNYASNYYYGRGDSAGRDPYRRDPYGGYDGYRGTSYLYERQPSPATTARPPPPKDGEVGVTEHPGADSKPADSPNSG